MEDKKFTNHVSELRRKFAILSAQQIIKHDKACDRYEKWLQENVFYVDDDEPSTLNLLNMRVVVNGHYARIAKIYDYSPPMLYLIPENMADDIGNGCGDAISIDFYEGE